MAAAGAALVSLAMSAGASAAPAGKSGQREQGRAQVFIRGAAIHGANGLAIDPHGRLLVASVLGAQLVALDRRSGRVVTRLGHDAGVDAPDDVATGPDGSIYWTDTILGQVVRLAPDGTVTKQYIAAGVNPIAFSSDGRLFVGQAFSGDGLYEVDPNLSLPPRVVIPDSHTAPFAQQLNGFDFGPDAKLYAPQPFLGTIVRIDPESGKTKVVSDALARGFPTSVEFDSRGRLYASLNDGTVVRVDRGTGAAATVVKIPDARFDNMVFGPDGTLYVSDVQSGAVYAVGERGRVRTLSRGGLILPSGLAMMPGDSGRESLFVADGWKLAQFDPRSGALVGLDRNSPTGGSVSDSWTVAPDGGRVIVTSFLSNAVQLWDPASHAAAGVFNDYAVPLNAIRFHGDLVVAELGTGSVTRTDQAGTRSVIAGGLSVPAGLAATDDDLSVADAATGSIWQLAADGSVLPQPRLTASGLHGPEGMAFDRDGSLLVVEAGEKRLVRVDPATGHVTTVADGLELGLPGSAAAPPTWSLSSVAVGRDGTIFVSADVAGVIYRIRPSRAAPGRG